MTRRNDLTYIAGSLLRVGTQQLDLYSPAGDTGRAHPAVVFVHGGGFRAGDKADGAAALTPLVKQGYVGVSINYRLEPMSPDVTLPLSASERARVMAAVSDTKAAVRWLRANAQALGVDPRRIAVMGSSAGAIAALTAAFTSDDQGDNAEHRDQSSAVCTAVSLMGASEPALVDRGDASALFVHGSADAVVPYAAAQATESAMRSAGLVTAFTTLPGEGHTVGAARADVAGAVSSWLRTHLARTTAPCR